LSEADPSSKGVFLSEKPKR